MLWRATKIASKISNVDKGQILVFDAETTGRPVLRDEIIIITILNGYGKGHLRAPYFSRCKAYRGMDRGCLDGQEKILCI